MSICSAVMPVVGTGHLEVHVAEVILVTQDVGQHGKAVAFLDQAHGDTGHVRLERHAGVHQRQAAAADRSHRGGAVGFGDFRNDAHRVREIFRLRQHGEQRALGQTAVADFAALRRTDAAAFAGGVRGHVVVQHEAIAVFAGQRVDDLLVAVGAERGNSQRLGFATGEQRRAVGARQHAGTHGDRAHGAGVATVDTRLAGQDTATHDGGFHFEEEVADRVGIRRTFFAGAQGGDGFGADLLDASGCAPAWW